MLMLEALISLRNLPSAASTCYSATLASLVMTLLLGPLSAYGQNMPDAACDLVDADRLRAPLPERFFGYEVADASVAPPIGDDAPESITLNVLYETEDGEAIFISVSHFCPGRREAETEAHWRSMVDLGRASATSYRGHTAYIQVDPPAGAVHVGEDFEVASHAASAGVAWDDVEEAIEVVRMDELEALAASAQDETADVAARETPKGTGAPAAEDRSVPEHRPRQPAAADRTAPSEAGRNCSFNEELRSRLPDELGGGEIELWPWAHPLSNEQVADAEITENRIAFPKEGNPWLECINRNDILWSPLATDPNRQFLLRVLEVTPSSDQIVFQTRSAGLDELFQHARIRVEEDDSKRP